VDRSVGEVGKPQEKDRTGRKWNDDGGDRVGAGMRPIGKASAVSISRPAERGVGDWDGFHLPHTALGYRCVFRCTERAVPVRTTRSPDFLAPPADSQESELI
jgi:hypothetical protein